MTTEIPRRFALKLRLFLDMKHLTVGVAAQKSGITKKRMEDLLSGAHVPLAGDVIRVQLGLGIHFLPEDFELRGLSL